MVAYSCVRTNRVLFVLPMNEELQPGQVNLYTTLNLLSGGVLSLVLVKKHNFVVFCFIRMFTLASMRHLPSLRLSFLTSCVGRSSTNGMVSQIYDSWLSRGVPLVL